MINKDEILKDMEEFLAEADAELLNIQTPEDIAQNGLMINDKATANYYVKQIQTLKQEKEELQQLAKAEKERVIMNIEKYEEHAIAPIQHKIDFLQEGLKAFMLNEAQGKKTIKLPDGDLTLRKVQPTINYGLHTLDFLKDNKLESYITTKTTEALDKKALRKDITVINGTTYLGDVEMPDIEVTINEDKFEVK